MKSKDFFTQLGLQKLSDQDKLDLSEDLGEIALDRIAVRIESLLTPEQIAEFEKTLETDETAAFELLKQFVPDYPTIAREEIDQLRAEIVHTHAAVMKKLNQ